MNIITLTLNPALDKNAKVDGLISGSKLKCHSIQYYPGGGGINVTRMLNRLGVVTNCIYPSGGDTGTFLTTLLKEEGTQSNAIPIKDWTRENLAVLDTKTNLQYRFGMPGNKINESELKTIMNMLSKNLNSNDILVLSGSLAINMSADFYSELIQEYLIKKVKVVIDTSGLPLIEALKKPVFLIKPNQREFAQLAGKAFLSNIEQKEFAKTLVKKGKAKYVVVSLGAKGAFLACAKGIFYQTTPAVPIKSTIGAGDSMVGGLIYGIIKKYTPKNILKYGVACGVATTMSEGTNLASYENFQKVLELMPD